MLAAFTLVGGGAGDGQARAGASYEAGCRWLSPVFSGWHCPTRAVSGPKLLELPVPFSDAACGLNLLSLTASLSSCALLPPACCVAALEGRQGPCRLSVSGCRLWWTRAISDALPLQAPVMTVPFLLRCCF